jgi:hypothetical protein
MKKLTLEMPNEFVQAIKSVAATVGATPGQFITNKLIAAIAREASYMAVYGDPPELSRLEFIRDDTTGELVTGDRLYEILEKVYLTLFHKQAQAQAKGEGAGATVH